MKYAIALGVAGIVALALYAAFTYVVVHFYEREVIIRKMEQRIYDND